MSDDVYRTSERQPVPRPKGWVGEWRGGDARERAWYERMGFTLNEDGTSTDLGWSAYVRAYETIKHNQLARQFDR